MTSSTSKPSLRPVSPEEQAAWAANNLREDEARRLRFGRMSFLDKLKTLESRGRESVELRQKAAQRAAKRADRHSPATRP